MTAHWCKFEDGTAVRCYCCRGQDHVESLLDVPIEDRSEQ